MESERVIINKIKKAINETEILHNTLRGKIYEDFEFGKLYEYKRYLIKQIIYRKFKKKELLKLKKDIKRKQVITKIDKTKLDLIKLKTKQQKGMIYLKEYFRELNKKCNIDIVNNTRFEVKR